MPYNRSIKRQIEGWMRKEPPKKVIIIYGARQVGKTTLAKKILQNYGATGRYVNCETLGNHTYFSIENPQKIKSFLGDYKIVVLDEAQKITNIGLVLKVLIDEFPNLQIIATGSSSFELANQVSEPLTGRSLTFLLFPLSVQEIKDQYDKLYVHEQLEKLLIFGSYPEIFTASLTALSGAQMLLSNLASNYLYKDILEFEQLKKSDLLMKLLKLLALQIGSEVNCNELAITLKTSRKTVERYLDLLEKAFVIFRLHAFSRNLRKEIGKAFKVYFYDFGIRNSLVNNFNLLELRSGREIGALWENFCVIERRKYNQAREHLVNIYFWRTYDQKEIDYLEEAGGKLQAFEFKWSGESTGSSVANNRKTKIPQEFLDTYSDSTFQVINTDNYLEFVCGDIEEAVTA